MKKIFYGTSILIFGVIFNFTASWAQKAVGPKMVIEEKAFYVQQVKEGAIIQHDFKVRNTGDSPLVIKEVKPG